MQSVKSLIVAGLALTGVSTATVVVAQETDYPTQPVTIVVPWSPGGAADIIARLISEPLGDELGQPVVIENRPGAGGTVGSATVARAEPDGYTLLMGNVSSQGIAPAFYADTIPYQVLEDFEPITQLIEQPSVLLVARDMEVDSLDEFVAYLEENPGSLYGTPGVGNSPYLAFELIKNSFGVEMTNVPYDSGGEVNNALASGDVQISINNIPTAMQAIENGIAKPLAVTSADRNPLLPNVPTFAESGNPELVVISWQGLFAPAGTPQEILHKVHQAATAALKAPSVVEQNDRLGSVPVGSTPAEFEEFVSSELEKWANMVALAEQSAE